MLFEQRASAPALSVSRASPKATASRIYRNRSVSLLIGYNAGGGYDAYARLLARYIDKHILGEPSIPPQQMTGIDSLGTPNYIFSVARKDGSVRGTFSRSMGIARGHLLRHRHSRKPQDSMISAFDTTMRDSKFLAEAQKLNFEIRPVSTPTIVVLLAQLYATPNFGLFTPRSAEMLRFRGAPRLDFKTHLVTRDSVGLPVKINPFRHKSIVPRLPERCCSKLQIVCKKCCQRCI